MRSRPFFVILCAVALLAGCEADVSSPKTPLSPQQNTAVMPLKPSGQAKAAPSVAAPPAVAGPELGADLKAQLGASDRAEAKRAELRVATAPLGLVVTWRNAQSGNSGTIVALRDGYAENGAYCRDFQQTIVLKGQLQQGQNRACQQPDGSWKAAS